MHVCFLCNEYPPARHGGIGSVTRTLARALVAAGHRATVVGVYAKSTGESDDRGVRVLRLPHAPTRGTGLLINSMRIRRALAALDRIDLVEGPELSLALLPRRTPYKKVIRMHGGHHFFAVTLGKQPSAWRSFLERRSFARADALCAVSRYVAETTRSLLRLHGTIEILPNPVDPQFAPDASIAPEPGVIAFAGTLTEKKGVRELASAMPRVVAAVPHAKLRVAGRDAGLAADLRRAWPAIEVLPALPHADMPRYLSRAEILAFPSLMEAQGLACLEGMAVGRPTLGSALGPGPELIRDGIDGVLADPRAPNAIADRLIELLSDAPLRARLGAAGAERVAREFSVATLIARNLAFYSRVATSAVSSP